MIDREDLEQACQLVLAAGYSTGHADTATQLVAEVLDQAIAHRDALLRMADFLEPHWRGSGLKLTSSDWMMERIMRTHDRRDR